jgi:beta-galactosidase
MYFGAAYYPEHRDPARWTEDLDRMAEAQVNALRVGEFAWKRFEPGAGEYDFSWLDRFLDLSLARGIRLLLCPPLRTAPAWLVEAHPDVAIETEAGLRLEYGSRYTFCILHPALRDRGLALAERLAERYGAHPGLIGWHLDNEYGDEPDCHCSRCAVAWREWLARRYGQVAAMNAAWGNVFWGLEYDHFGQVPTPRRTKAIHNPAHLQCWRQFRSDVTVACVADHAAAVRRHSRLPVTTNNQSLWNNRTDYYDLAEHLDVTGTNYYPPFGARTLDSALGLAACRSYKRRNFQVHELRSGPQNIPGAGFSCGRPGELTRLTLHTVANGADAVFYFRWRICPFGAEQQWGAITDYDGQPTRIYEEVRSIGAGLCRLGSELEGTSVWAEAALLYDFPSRWNLETGSPLNAPVGLYLDRVKLAYRSIRRLGYACDAAGRKSDWTGYRVLVVPLLPLVDDRLAERLESFVAGGGFLVLHPWCGTKDGEGRYHPGRLHPRLEALAGLRLRDYVPLDADSQAGAIDPENPGQRMRSDSACGLTWGGQEFSADLYADLIDPVDTQVEAVFTRSWFSGRPAVTRRDAGRGRVYYVATFPGESFYDSFGGALLAESGSSRIWPDPLPAAVEVAERRAPDGRRLVFLLNAGGEPHRLMAPCSTHDLWQDERIDGAFTLAPLGVRILRF